MNSADILTGKDVPIPNDEGGLLFEFFDRRVALKGQRVVSTFGAPILEPTQL
jgi:hypothetical protein